MKTFLSILFGLFIFSACEENKKGDLLVNQAVGNLRNDVDAISSSIESEYNKGMRRPLDKLVYLESQKYKGWRDAYLKTRTRAALLAYSDSIASQFNKHGWDVVYINHTYPFIKQLKEKRQLILKSDDSIVQQELLFWILEAERFLQNNLAAKFDPGCRIGPPYDIYLNGEKFNLGDTVYAIFEIHPNLLNGLRYNSDSLFVTNIETKQNIAKDFFQVGPYFTIRVVPKQKGTFMITGKMKFYNKQFNRHNVYLEFDKKPFQVY